MTPVHRERAQLLLSGRALSLIAAALVGALATSGAKAFTFNDQVNGGDSNSAVKFADPAERAKSRMTGDSSDKTTIRNGNTTMQFGGREPYDQRYNSNRYFDSNSLMGR